jgi:hypothetical protein
MKMDIGLDIDMYLKIQTLDISIGGQRTQLFEKLTLPTVNALSFSKS